MFLQSLSTTSQYLQLLDLVYEVAQSLKGKPSSDFRWPSCQQLATKLFFHAATIYWLRESSTKAPVPHSINGCSFFDFSSVAVLTRAVLETYLTMFEVFFEPTTDDEFEFKHALWLLSGFVLREDFVSLDPIIQSQFTKEIQVMRTRLQKTKKYESLKPSEQRKVSKGMAIRSWKAIAKAAGFGELTIQQVYAYYSGYVHADGLSGTQIVTAKTAQDQVEHIEIHMRTIMIVLSKMILDYAKKFPEAKAACDKNPETFYLAEVLSGAASHLP
jgi:hypothetical protein